MVFFYFLQVRYRLKKDYGIETGIPVVFSLEKPKVKLLPFKGTTGEDEKPSDYQVSVMSAIIVITIAIIFSAVLCHNFRFFFELFTNIYFCYEIIIFHFVLVFLDYNLQVGYSLSCNKSYTFLLCYQIVPGFRVRIIPVLGTIPAIFGQVMASYVLTQLAGFFVQTEPVVTLDPDHYRVIYQRLIEHEELVYGSAEQVLVRHLYIFNVTRLLIRMKIASKMNKNCTSSF